MSGLVTNETSAASAAARWLVVGAFVAAFVLLAVAVSRARHVAPPPTVARPAP
jgi:hypothetical protein